MAWTSTRTLLSCFAGLGLVAGCGGDTTGSTGTTGTGGATLAQALFVAHAGVLTSYDIATGEQRPGEIQDIAGPTDMQALADGSILVNLTDKNQILVFDGNKMLETARIPSSTTGATRPVHSYLSPERNGKSYWMSLNDGDSGKVETNSARFVDVTPGSKTYLQAAGEVGLGIGHHKATFSAKGERVVITNIGDCDNVLSVYDYSDVTSIKKLATLTAKDAGWDGSSFPKTCDPTYQMGLPPAPHGCATSKLSGKAYCNLTSSGGIVSIDIDATPPTFKVVPTTGGGGGYTKAHPGGRYIYSLQAEPREGGMQNPGVTCQVGQLVVIDAMTDSIAKTVPLLYKGPGCTDVLVKTDEETTEPSHMLLSDDGKKLFVEVAGGFGVKEARVRQELIVDLSDPASPTQLASVPVGTSTGYHGDSLTGDGKLLFIANNQDGTVTQIDAASNKVLGTIKVKDSPQTMATFGANEGPSEQTGPIH